jgi:hypothetical protein
VNISQLKLRSEKFDDDDDDDNDDDNINNNFGDVFLPVLMGSVPYIMKCKYKIKYKNIDFYIAIN